MSVQRVPTAAEEHYVEARTQYLIGLKAGVPYEEMLELGRLTEQAGEAVLLERGGIGPGVTTADLTAVAFDAVGMPDIAAIYRLQEPLAFAT